MKLTGGRVWPLVIAGLLLASAFVVLWVSSAALLSDSVGVAPAVLAPLLLGSLADNAALVLTLLMTLLLVLSPSSESLSRLMAMSPITARDAFVGLLLPGGAATLVMAAGLFGGPVLVVVSAGWRGAGDRVWVSVVVLASLLYLLVVTAVAMLAAERLVGAVFAVPVRLARLSGSMLVMAAAIASSLAQLRRLTSEDLPSGPVVSPFNWPLAGADLAGAASRFGWLALIVSVVALVGLLGFAVSSRGPVSGEVSARGPLRRFAARHPAVTHTLAWSSAMRFVREPEVMAHLALYFAGFASLAAACLFRPLGPAGSMAMSVAWLLAPGLALLSYGFVARSRWVTDVSPISDRAVMLSGDLTVGAVCVVAGAVLMALASVAARQVTGREVLAATAFGLSMLVTMRVAGVLVPYDRQVPLSALFPGAVALVLGVAVFFLLTKLPGGAPAGLAAVAVLAAAGHEVNVRRHRRLRL